MSTEKNALFDARDYAVAQVIKGGGRWAVYEYGGGYRVVSFRNQFDPNTCPMEIVVTKAKHGSIRIENACGAVEFVEGE